MSNKCLVKFKHDKIVHIIDADKIVTMNFWVDEVRKEINLSFELIGCDQGYDLVVEIDEPRFGKPFKWIKDVCNIVFPILDSGEDYCQQIDVYDVLNDIEELVEEKFGTKYTSVEGFVSETENES